jgi:sugar phosphate isomerase/epimerase
MDLLRLSLNSMTVPSLSLDKLIDACLARGIGAIAPWRQLLEEPGVEVASRWIADAGLRMSSLCRGGMFTAPGQAARTLALEDNRRAVEEAAALGADVLVLVCGPVVDKDVTGSYSMVRDGIGALLETARAAGVTLGVEPLHPMMAADRSVITRIDDALNLIAELGDDPALAVIVDAYHVWWDHQLPDQLARAGGRIRGLHVSDWVTPLSGALASGRGMMGDGCIDLPGLCESVGGCGYSGPIEVEILSDHWWNQSATEVLDLVVERFRTRV